MARQIMLAIAVAVISAVTAAVLMLRFNYPSAPAATLPQAEFDQLAERLAAHPALQGAFSGVKLQVIDKAQEEAWVQGMGADGLPRPGPADDIKPLADSKNSVCFLTDIEIQHVSDAADQLACRVMVDEFTGFWEVHAIQGEGTDASVRCNASCVSWQ